MRVMAGLQICSVWSCKSCIHWRALDLQPEVLHNGKLYFWRRRFREMSVRAAAVDEGKDAQTSGPKMLKIVAISGSFRKASIHQGLLRASAQIVKEHLPDVEFETLDISRLPFVDTDLESGSRFPEFVEQFRAKIVQAHGILFACPEYNFSFPGVLKNAIDWGSRPPNVWADKAAAIVSAGGGAGGALANNHLRQVGVFIDLHFMNKPLMYVRAHEPPPKFDGNGDLVDEATRVRLQACLLALRIWTLRLQPHSP